ncbi:MAG: CapA family protein [Clostridia bacterium]|nr:CapA family protein [Clostridia bacterium]MCL6521456.1 CapA family protein [Bacillota bacterium]
MEREETLKIVAVGDVAPLERPSGEVWLDLFRAADLRLANLEGPIVEGPGVPADKLIRLRLPSQAADWLAELGLDAVSLANNHTMDWGAEALVTTRRRLAERGIRFGGAGMDWTEAARPVRLAAGGKSVALVAWACTVPPGFQAAEGRPGIAGIKVRTRWEADAALLDEQPGTPPWVHTEPVEADLRRMEESLARARREAEFVILSLHWGVPPQWSSAFQGTVAEYQLRVAARAVAAGADLIVGHHPHAPYGLGEIEGVPVLYSLGNFLFHPEYLPGGMESALEGPAGGEPEASAALYAPVRLPENEESSLAWIELAASAGARLRIRRLRLVPARLNRRGEAVRVAPDEADRIARRLEAFSRRMGARVRVEEGCLEWEGGI